jgi:hypothetical protein
VTKENSQNSSQPSSELTDSWEKQLQALDDRLRASGRTVTVREPQSDTNEFVVTFPQGKWLKAKPQSDANTYVAPLPLQRNKASQVCSAIITVEWGYECHSITLNPGQWARVLSGEPLGVAGPGYNYEGESFKDYWDFGGGLGGSLSVSYGDDGAEGYRGTLCSHQIQEVALKGRAKRTSKKTPLPADK